MFKLKQDGWERVELGTSNFYHVHLRPFCNFISPSPLQLEKLKTVHLEITAEHDSDKSKQWGSMGDKFCNNGLNFFSNSWGLKIIYSKALSEVFISK